MAPGLLFSDNPTPHYLLLLRTVVKLLAIETSTEACSAALLVDDQVRERFALAPREHAALILGMCESLLSEAGLAVADLDAVAFGRGPGSFTGVRIAAGVVQGIAFAVERPVIPVSTLQTLAQGALRELGQTEVLAAIDARMGEIYWGGFRAEGGLMVPSLAEQVASAEGVEPPEGGHWFGVGTGWGSYGEALSARLTGRLAGWDGERFPHAQDVALLAAAAFAAGEAIPPEQALPVYLRDNVAKKPGGIS